MRRRIVALVGVLALVTGLGGCMMTSGDFGGGGGGFGATQGGVQDMTLARDLVDQGRVPPPEAFVVEAMFSEHDLPLEGAACDSLLCLRAAMGVAPSAAGDDAAWIQVGLSSTIDPASFVRPTQSIIAVVDVSGSMGWDYPNDVTAGALARRLLEAIADQLHGEDRFALVTFGSLSRIELGLTSGADQQTIHRAIGELCANGSTDMESGLRTAIPLARAALGQTDEVRIMIFSDYQPNVGATEPTEFQQLALEAAEDGVGLTLFGLGLGLGPAIMKAMSEIRGANAFSATDAAGVDLLMEDSWPWMVSPIAYELSVSVRPAEGIHVEKTYGFPGEPTAGEAKMEVATVFLSRRRGALLVELAPDAAVDLRESGAQAGLSLSYVTPEGRPMTQDLTVSYDGQPLSGAGSYLPQEGLAKTVALALLVSGMKEAAEAYQSNHAEAVAIMQAVLERLQADVADLEDEAMNAEVAFAQKLLDLMESDATQGNFYY